MSIWTHVDCIIKVDSKNTIEDFTKIFGKELDTDSPDWNFYRDDKDKYDADFKKWCKKSEKDWDEWEKHPERFLPVGSEGSLHMKTRLQTIVKDTLYPYRYKVEIYGGLRDHYDPDGVIDRIREGINKLKRTCCMKVHIEARNYLNGLCEYNFEDVYFRDKDFYKHIEYTN